MKTKKAPPRNVGAELKNQSIGLDLLFCGGVTRFDPLFAENTAALFRSLSQLLAHNSFLYVLLPFEKQAFVTENRPLRQMLLLKTGF